MNRYIRRVFDVYAFLLLLSVLVLPWKGRRLDGLELEGGPLYALLWRPPQAAGWWFVPDAGRLLLEVVSLTLVMAAAVAVLRDRSGAGRRSDPPA